MMKKYFIIKGGRKIGPLTVKEVFEQRPTLDTQVWCDGMDDWKRLENVEELAYGFPNRPTPPPIPQKETPKSNNTKPVTTPKNGVNTKRFIIPIIIAAIVVILGIVFLVCYNNYNHEKLRIQQELIQKQEEQEKLEREEMQQEKMKAEAARKKNEALEKKARIQKLKHEMNILYAQSVNCSKRLEDAREIHPFRTRSEKAREINALNEELAGYLSRMSEVDAELVRLGEKSMMDNF